MSNIVGTLKPKIVLEGTLHNMGTKGYSAYEVAVQQGFKGTVDEWLESLVGAQGDPGKTGEQGPSGPPGIQGEQGIRGESGVYIGNEEPTNEDVMVWIDTDGEADENPSEYVLPIASNNTLGGIKVGANLIIDADGTLNAQAGGEGGASGATFIPNVSSEGVISWSNDKGLSNPTPVNIRGPQGNSGVYLGNTEPSDENTNIWINPDGDGIEYVDETRVIQLIDTAITGALGGEY
jgi:hypothetical protein